MFRKILIIALILIIAAGVSYFFYISRRGAAPVVELPGLTDNTPKPVELLPSTDPEIPETVIETAALRSVAKVPILNYWIDAGDRTMYLATAEGIVYSVSATGGEPVQVFRIPEMAKSSIVDVVSNKATAAALVEYRSFENKRAFSLIDPVLNSTHFLPLGTIAAAWSPSGKEVVYLQENQKNTASGLFIYTVGSNNSKQLTTLNILEPVISWPDQNEVIISSRSSGSSETGQWKYNIKNKTLVRVGVFTRGLSTVWNKKGSLAARYSSSNGPLLEIINSSGKPLAMWPKTTLPEKCFFEDFSVFCATPTDTKLPPRFRDTYLMRGLYTNDSLLMMPIAGGSPLADQASELPFSDSDSSSIDAYHLEKVGSTLYFINRYDNLLYAFSVQE